jgi:hypothetical protein
VARLAFGGAEFAHVHADGLVSSGIGGTLSYDATVARTGARSFKIASAAAASSSAVSALYTYGLLATGTLYGRIAFRFDALPSAAVVIASWTNGASPVVRADLNADGSISFRTGASGLIGTSAALSTGTWNVVEFSLQGFGVSGSGAGQGFWADGRLNGSALGVSTNVSASPNLSNVQFRFGFVSSVTLSNTINLNFDDWVINDATGAADNTWVGPDEGCVLLLPASDGTIGANWKLGDNTSPSSNAFASLDNVPPTGKAVGSGLAGDQLRDAVAPTGVAGDEFSVNLQTYTAAGIAAGGSIRAVQVVAEAAPSTASAVTLGVQATSNPVVSETTTATSAASASAYPTSWTRVTSAIVSVPSVTLGSAPVVKARYATGTTTALVSALGLYVAYTPGLVVNPPSIASAEAFGTPTVQTQLGITGAGGIASAEAFGDPLVLTGGVPPDIAVRQSKDVVVRAQALDGTWETIGTDRARGVWPENVGLVTDQWGSASASFDLRRDPGSPWPDIGAFAPIDVMVGGVKVWSGRVKETPAHDGADRVLNVQCEGWQYHLDDDVYARGYVRTRLSDFQDMRSAPLANLSASALMAAGVVSSDNGSLYIGIPNGTTVDTGSHAAAYLDLGPDPASWAKRAVVTWTAWGAGAGTISFVIRGSDAPDNNTSTVGGWGTGRSEDIYFADTIVGPTTTAGTFTTPRRYLHLVLYQSGVPGPYTADAWVKATGLLVASDTAYESGNASVLKASQVVSDALDRGTVLLSSDRSQIATTAFSIPTLAFDEPVTPRAVIDGVNAYHNYTTMVDVERRMVFAPQEAAPRWELGAWSAMEFDDASANSGQDVYDRVIVTGNTPAGEPFRVERLAADTTRGGNLYIVDHLTPINQASTYTTSGSPTKFVRRVYSVSFTYSAASGTAPLRIRFGDTAGSDFAEVNVTATTTPQTVWLTWMPQAVVTTAAYAEVKNSAALSGPVALADMAVYTSAATLVDRRAFRRTMILPISSALPGDGVAQAQIGDVWLAAHRTTPFRGTVTLTGDAAVRDILTGAPVPLERLLLAPRALIRFSDRIDPDTGAHGRDGRIAAVSYSPATEQATLTIDSSRANVEAMLSRLAVISGG